VVVVVVVVVDEVHCIIEWQCLLIFKLF